MVYDSVHRRSILTHGSPDRAAADSTWAYDAVLRQWTKLAVSAVGPQSRDWAKAVYDPLRDSLILVGGIYGGDYLSDAWELHNNV
jgi:hypothetical protein